MRWPFYCSPFVCGGENNSIKIANKVIKGKGRILVRKSGTEAKIRVMGESEDKVLLKKSMNLIVKKII